MKLYLKIIFVFTLFMIYCMLSAPTTFAKTKIFIGVGEYTMSDYETPTIAEQRAIAYAKERAAEQAGVYVESYTRMENAVVTKDMIKTITIGTIKLTEQKIDRKTLSSGDVRIIASVTAEVSDDKIELILRNNIKDEQDHDDKYKELLEAIKKETRETEELKQKIADLKFKQLPINDLKLENKAKELEFLSNKKVEECIILRQNRKYTKMLETAEEAVQLNPKNEKAYFQRGRAHRLKKQYDKAIEDFNNVLVFNPSDRDAFIFRGSVYRTKRQFSKAIEDFNHVLTINPNYEEAYFQRGRTYQLKGDYDKAIADFTVTLKLASNHRYARISRGYVYFAIKEYDNAIEDFNQTLALYPNYAKAYYGRANAYRYKGEYELAIADYQEVLKLEPDHEGANKNLQIVIERQKVSQ